MMGRILCTVCLLLITTFACADDATKHAKVQELLQLSHMQERAEQTKAAMLSQARAFGAQQLASFGLAGDKAATTYYDKLYTLVATRHDWSKLQTEYEKVYFDLYTEEELDGILTFYKSPIGKALLAKTPEANSRLLQISKEQSDALAPAIEKLTKEFVAEIQAQYNSRNPK